MNKPTWCFKPVTNIKNLDDIQLELRQYMVMVNPDPETWIPKTKYIPKKHIEQHTPLFVEYLKSLGIYDRWSYSLMIYTNNGETLPIHVDSTAWQIRSFSLNIPTLNCANTFTTFYDAEIISDADQSSLQNNTYVDTNLTNGNSPARFVKEGCTPVEIARMDSNQPAWINYGIPHTPIAYHNLPRGVFSSRFEPELHDIIDNL